VSVCRSWRAAWRFSGGIFDIGGKKRRIAELDEQTGAEGFWNAADKAQTVGLMHTGATCIAYETVTDRAGTLPLLAPMSEVAGRMSVQVGAHCLEKEQGGAGILLGGVPGVAEKLRDNLTARFPNLQVVGCFTPPFRPLDAGEEKQFQEMVHAAQPDIMWVGLSTPKQEKFMAEFLPKLDVTLMIGVGAAFDFHSGRVKQAPRWMQRNGLEWLYRLWQEPRRLAKRYLKNNPLFALKIAGQLSGLKKYPLE